MNKFTHIRSAAVPLPIENIDTDQIIPARFLKSTTRDGFGKNLFRDWRFDKNDEPINTFPLNESKYKGQILVVGKNFGCGSSREHAAWAICDYGFSVVVSSFFADIFKNNCFNNGILPVQVEPVFLNKLFDIIEKDPQAIFEVDLPQQQFTITKTADFASFNINQYKKECLINGFDDIDFLIQMKDKIAAFEKRHLK